MITQKMVDDALQLLGKTAPDVARTLTDLGITGLREHAAGCPVACYLRRVLPGAKEVSVGHLEGIRVDGIFANYHGAVLSFIHRFDLNEFPDLVFPDLVEETK